MSYLNSTPLIWGVLHGPQQGLLDLRFEIPATCADLLRSGDVDIGLVPVIELERQELAIIGHLGIASCGPVRSILLIAKVDPEKIMTVAADSSSRTSVVLLQLLMRERWGCQPRLVRSAPVVDEMLEEADACLVIGDPALRFDAALARFHVLDLGAEWTAWSGLPMVYAAWAARSNFDGREASEILEVSWQYGSVRRREIAQQESAARGMAAELAYDYLTNNIQYELRDNHEEGLARFRFLARSAGLV